MNADVAARHEERSIPPWQLDHLRTIVEVQLSLIDLLDAWWRSGDAFTPQDADSPTLSVEVLLTLFRHNAEEELRAVADLEAVVNSILVGDRR